jgi:signal transduction histidine kinase
MRSTLSNSTVDRRAAVAAAIERQRSEIIAGWLKQVSADVQRAGKVVEETELRDGVGDYLSGLAQALAEDDAADRRGREAWKHVAREHALTRVRLGFDIDELVREFIVLRRTIVGTLRAHGVALDEADATRLADLIEAAIATCVRSYVDSRDFQMRRQEAEHIGFLTHELRNPLTIARVAASQLRREPPHAPREQHVIELLDRGLERIGQLIDKVLMTEALEAGAVEAHPAATPLGAIMEDVLGAARIEAGRKAVTLEARYDPELSIHVDAGLTVSALQNLLDNAVKFTDEGLVEVTVEDGEDAICVHVRDSCRGISAEELRTIFEPFRRGHSGKSGSGLGLAIARRAVLAQGGTIQAESNETEGCHFWFTLPRKGAERGGPHVEDPHRQRRA